MKTHQIHITEERIKVLTELIGKEVYILFAPNLSISTEENIMTSSYFNMNFLSRNKLGINTSKVFKFRTKPFEENDIDFYKIEFAIKKEEKQLKDNFDQYVFQNLNSIISFAPSSKIDKIQVLNYKYVFNSENPNFENTEVDYDDGILFFQENGKRFLFSCYHSLTEESEFIRDEKSIKKRIKELKVRKEIKNVG
ncbi:MULTISPECIES: hypothetical protein [unclassified Polaribacter]|uniref:hypothetical protein n=1 Tax=unclassified Polaribacter TaxID=196858 RepID=UPI0011BEB938|nr:MULTISPECIES: hypothetical protein [unclassified Polaribacter]TXD48505.1 hypothetical protein ES043_17710 [Polaribacter sp. IC063]TXD55849.1 hypothetical protein ES044_17645 [Polaribacter sp. IC066]